MYMTIVTRQLRRDRVGFLMFTITQLRPVFLALALSCSLLAHADEEQGLIIRNVYVSNPGSSAPSELMNLRVIDGNIDVVSKDKIEQTGGEMDAIVARVSLILQ